MSDPENLPAISGVYAAIPTPFDAKKQVDTKALTHIVEYLTSMSLDGLALFTECAEDAVLTPEERRSILKLVCSVADRRKKLVVSISSVATQQALELAKAAEHKGAVALVVSLARIPGIGYRELFRHLERIRKGGSAPIILDARPGNVLESLSAEELNTLVGHSTLAGAFIPTFSSGSLEAWRKRFKSDAKPSFLTASSLGFARAHEQGASGSLCAMAVIAPEQAVKISRAIAANDAATVSKLENQLRPVVEVLGPPSAERSTDGIQRITQRIAKRDLAGPRLSSIFPAALIKEALRLQGHPVRSEVRSPFESVRADASEKLRTVLTMGGLV
ncbi:MAG: dihydrodipicolinate synthase family protein [Deltaproteobacteria bacterium]|nr:dihydrodipicolinate synthase family protein [Deltaproteobacteria bacterium]